MAAAAIDCQNKIAGGVPCREVTGNTGMRLKTFVVTRAASYVPRASRYKKVVSEEALPYCARDGAGMHDQSHAHRLREQARVNNMNDGWRLRALIAENERPTRERMRELLLRAGADIVGSAASGEAAIAAVLNLDPDVLVIDVQMRNATGLDVLEAIGIESMPATICVTASDRHALRAFDVAAVDCLLKPFSDERFAVALERARERCHLQRCRTLLSRLRHVAMARGVGPGRDATDDSRFVRRFSVESRRLARVIPVEQIDYISASGTYAELHVGEAAYVVRGRMQVLEQRLDPRQFMRVHRSIIVQLDRVELLKRNGGGDYTLKLVGGRELAVSRKRIRELESWMGVSEPGENLA